jgi:hypothetical protein
MRWLAGDNSLKSLFSVTVTSYQSAEGFELRVRNNVTTLQNKCSLFAIFPSFLAVAFYSLNHKQLHFYTMHDPLNNVLVNVNLFPITK